MSDKPIPRTAAAALLKLEALGGVADHWDKFAMIETGNPRRRFNAFRFVRWYIVDLNNAKRLETPGEYVPALWAFNDKGRAALAAIKEQR